MDMTSRLRITPQAEDYLQDLAAELEIPPSRYEQAFASYASLGDWLHREKSTIRVYDPQVYVQGSFRLGTAIRPYSDAEDYDVDSVCELRRITKGEVSQCDLKERLEVEIRSYHRAQNMVKPVREGRRCWILDYADGAQFHMDIVPALPNGPSARLLLERHGYNVPWSDTAIAITDNHSDDYTTITDDWPRSNPKGYAQWFRDRMPQAFDRRRREIAAAAEASVEAIPDWQVRRTPLQSAIMILKRHRDIMFEHRHDEQPISIIITTLAAHAYQGEDTIGTALLSILTRMDHFILEVGGRYIIANPTDPLENFADKWPKYPERAEAFFEWLQKAREDFGHAVELDARRAIADRAAQAVGQSLAERARDRNQPQKGGRLLRAASVAPTGLAFPSQARVPTKPAGFA